LHGGFIDLYLVKFMLKAHQKRKKKKKKNRPILDYLAYVMVRLAGTLIQIFDINTSLCIARWLGGGLYLIYHRGRQRAIDNLINSYPDKPNGWHERTARRSFEHLVMFAFDVFYTSRLVRPSNWHRCIDLGNISNIIELVLNKQGAIMVTAHYGNFLVLGLAMDTFGMPMFNIARPIDNPYIDRYVYDNLLRSQTVIYKKGATDAMVNVLKSGNALGIVGDQNGKSKDVFVNFFGRKAATYKSIALMAMQYNVPVIVSYARRIDDQYRFHIGVQRIIQPHEWQNQPDPLYWITNEWTRAIEQFIREDPQQYWWVHRRWKTRPPEEKNTAKTQTQ
jgi:KDO2-lipid IV(A) lauroyltransferase